MSIPAGHTRLVFSGALPGGEIWSTGFFTDDTASDHVGGAFQASINTLGAALVSRVGSIFTSKIGTGGALERLDGYYYTGGSNKAAQQAQYVFNQSGTGSPQLPNQCSVVATLLSGLPGRSQRGRMYLPVLVGEFANSPDVQMTQDFTEFIATALANVLNQADAEGFHPVVVSSTKTTAVPVTDIRVDSKVDTQRRRSDKTRIRYRSTVAIGT